MLANSMVRMTNASKYVIEYNGRHYVAIWNKRSAQYEGSLTKTIKKLTGCSGFSCKSKAGLPGAGGYSYRYRSDALRKARELYGLD
jgi:hypothetical protein